MGRPKKGPDEQLRTVGTRVSPSLLRKVHSVMQQLKRQGKIARANESAACAWLIGVGMAALDQAADAQLEVILEIWPDLNDVAREALIGAARGLHAMETMRKESSGNVRQIDAAHDNGPDKSHPAISDKKKPGGNGSHGKKKEPDEEEERDRYVA